MMVIWDYCGKAVSGLQRYFDNNKLVVILFAILIVCWVWEQKQIDEYQNKFLTYSLFMIVILIIPFSAIFVLIYQTPFYDYEWAWSMVPVTALIAYGLTVFSTWTQLKVRKWLAMLLTVVLILLCGNQGMLQKIPSNEKKVKENIDEVLQGIHCLKGEKEIKVWAPHLLMQEIRRQDGSIRLLYGRDMWDEKAGAYDYEAYTKEVTDAYLWMTDIAKYTELAETMEKPADTMQLLVKEYGLLEEAEKSLDTVIAEGANMLVFPGIMSIYLEEDISAVVKKYEKVLQETYTEKYVIYFVN